MVGVRRERMIKSWGMERGREVSDNLNKSEIS